MTIFFRIVLARQVGLLLLENGIVSQQPGIDNLIPETGLHTRTAKPRLSSMHYRIPVPHH